MKYLVIIEIFGHNFMFGQKCFCCRMLPSFKINILKKSYRHALKVSNGLDADQDGCSVGPNLGPHCLQRLSADDKSYPYIEKMPNIRLQIVHLGRYIVGIILIFEGPVHV